MDNRPIPPGVKPSSQLAAPPPVETAFDSNPEEGTPVNPNSGIQESSPPPEKGGFVERHLSNIPGFGNIPAPVRDFIAKRPATTAGIAVLTGLALLVARRRPRYV